jgi:hypothetical protein
MRLSGREKSMLLVALDNLVCDYRKTKRRAVRSGSQAIVSAAEEAINRYTKLAGRIAR